MQENFVHRGYPLGIEEELMILDPESWSLSNGIEALLEEAGEGEVHPELHESVLEISVGPLANTAEAVRELAERRRQVAAAAERRGLRLGSSGTHPFALWEDQRISAGPRYRRLVHDLRFVARQEVIFGLHVHVGLDDRETAIHVANAMRPHAAVLLALSANSPFWRGERTGMASSRMPIFRAFPRSGMPPHYDSWADYEQRIGFMVETGVMDDYTFLWYDVRPHPNLGTVEIRCMDAQTRVEHTAALAALVHALVKEAAEDHRAGGRLERYPGELLDENRWLAARGGLDAELVDLPRSSRVPARKLARGLYERARPHARELGSDAELEGVLGLLEEGTGAARQLLVYEANHDLTELVRDLAAATLPA